MLRSTNEKALWASRLVSLATNGSAELERFQAFRGREVTGLAVRCPCRADAGQPIERISLNQTHRDLDIALLEFPCSIRSISMSTATFAVPAASSSTVVTGTPGNEVLSAIATTMNSSGTRTPRSPLPKRHRSRDRPQGRAQNPVARSHRTVQRSRPSVGASRLAATSRRWAERPAPHTNCGTSAHSQRRTHRSAGEARNAGLRAPGSRGGRVPFVLPSTGRCRRMDRQTLRSDPARLRPSVCQ